jgi:hypothetical protein
VGGGGEAEGVGVECPDNRSSHIASLLWHLEQKPMENVGVLPYSQNHGRGYGCRYIRSGVGMSLERVRTLGFGLILDK